MFKKVFSYALIVLVIAFTFAGSSGNLLAEEAATEPTAADETVTGNFSDIDALFARAAEFGSVRVIIGFEVGFQPEGALLSGAQVENQRMSIDLAQDVVLNSLAAHDVRNVKRFDYVPYMAMEVDEAALDALWSNPNIVSIHEDVLVPPTLADSVPLINADDVWNLGFDGSGIAVAILDTGVRKKHEFLDGGKVVSEACYSTTTSSSSTACPNGQDEQVGPGAGVNCPTTWDGCFHGTHVAGIAAGKGGAGGLKGVAKGADIIAIQVFSKFTGSDCTSAGYSSPCVFAFESDLMEGLERVYALRNKHKIAAVNMSLGGGRYFSHCDGVPLKAYIDNLRSAGIATVISSGNSYYKDSMGFPACISSAISVGATDKSDVVAAFSNSASFLDLLAPGVSIRSSVPINKYAKLSGTSMAAPHVAGAFALMRQANQGASVDDIKASLVDTGVGVTDTNGITKPRINIVAAVNDLGYLRPEIDSPKPDTMISASPVTFTWTANGLLVTRWQLRVGTTPGDDDVFDGDNLAGGVRFQEVDCLPLTGANLYVRLRYKLNGVWLYSDFQYTTADNSPDITFPLTPSLPDNMVTFTWDDNGQCVDAWKLYVGSSPGAKNLHDSGKLPGSAGEHTVKGLPFDGSDVHVRLRYQIGGKWYNKDYQYTSVTWSIGITTIVPAPSGSQLTSRDVTFNWSDGGAGVVDKWRLLIGSGTGKNDYYDSGNLGTLDQLVENLPFDGRMLYVRLKFKIHGIWEYANYQYAAVDTLPKITSPVPGSTLGGYSVAFQWTPELFTVKKWRLLIGSKPGENNYFDSGVLAGAITDDICDKVPTDGSTIHVTLKYKKGSTWKSRKYKYTAADLKPEIFAPAGPDLADTTVNFQWQKNNAYIRNYRLRVGSSPGGNDLHDSGTLPKTADSREVTGLPFDGSPVYVQLRYKSGVKWKKLNYPYTAVDTAPEITSPTPGSTLGHSTVTFEWESNISVENYRLLVGKIKGDDKYHDSGKLDGALAPHTMSKTVNMLPINGRTLYVRLKFKVGGVWYKKDYQYTAVTWNFMITSPEPKSRFSSSAVTFSWTANDSPVDAWRLKVGTSVGSGNKFNSKWQQDPGYTSQYVSGLPRNGKKIYVRLEAEFDGDVHRKDYWYRAENIRSYHRIYNRLVCPFDNSRPSVTISVCGGDLTAGFNQWSSCKAIDSTYCTAYFEINSGACMYNYYLGGLDFTAGCVYSYDVWATSIEWRIDIYQKCPGTCSTAKPFAAGQSPSELDDAGELIRTIKIPLDGDSGLIQ